MAQEITLELSHARVAPADKTYETGIKTASGRTQPFIVERGWSGPGGAYNEQWSIRRGGREVIHASEAKQISVRGIQSITRYTDRVETPIQLSQGKYQLVFIVDGWFMDSIEIEVTEGESAAA